MEDSKTCKHNWVNKGFYEQCSLRSEIKPFDFTRMNGIILDLNTDNDQFHQLGDEAEQSRRSS